MLFKSKKVLPCGLLFWLKSMSLVKESTRFTVDRSFGSRCEPGEGVN